MDQFAHAKSEIVFGRIPSWILTRSHLKFLRRCPIHEAHPMSFVLQEVPSRYLERAMMVVQNLTSLETFQCFSNQPAPSSFFPLCQYLCGKLCKSVKDAHVYIQDLICQDGNQTTQNIFENLLQVDPSYHLGRCKRAFCIGFQS